MTEIIKTVWGSVVLGFSLTIGISLGVHWYLHPLRQAAQNPMMLETSLSASRYLNSAVIGGTSTVLALILNLLSMGNSSQKQMERSFYIQIKAISLLSTLALILSVAALLFTSFPVTQSEQFPQNLLPRIYWSFIVLETVIVSLLLSQIFVLMQTTWTMIGVVKPAYKDTNEKNKSLPDG